MQTTYLRRIKADDGRVTFDQHEGMHGWQPILDLEELFGDAVSQERTAIGFKVGGVLLVISLAVWAVVAIA